MTAEACFNEAGEVQALGPGRESLGGRGGHAGDLLILCSQCFPPHRYLLGVSAPSKGDFCFPLIAGDTLHLLLSSFTDIITF